LTTAQTLLKTNDVFRKIASDLKMAELTIEAKAQVMSEL